MNLYFVYNGFQGNSPVHVEVVAENEKKAAELASEVFKNEAYNPLYDMATERWGEKFINNIPHLSKYKYSERYWTNLEVEFKYKLHESEKERVSEVLD